MAAVAQLNSTREPHREEWNEAFDLVTTRIRAIDSEQRSDPSAGDIQMPSAQGLYADAAFVAAVAKVADLVGHAAELTSASARMVDERACFDPAVGGWLAYAAEGLQLDGGVIQEYGEHLTLVASKLLGGLPLPSSA
jgi:hypothetical protein